MRITPVLPLSLCLAGSLTCLSLGGCNRSEPAAAPPPAQAAPAAAANGAAVAPPSAVAAAPLTATPAPKVAAAPAKFGAPLSAEPALTAQVVIADPKKYDDKDIKLTGQVNGVCQHKGCWMTIGTGEPGSASVRVQFKDYGFFVPTDCTGRTAVVEGHFKMTTLSVGEAQHYADDAAKAGTAPQKITAPQATLALMATGVELL